MSGRWWKGFSSSIPCMGGSSMPSEIGPKGFSSLKLQVGGSSAACCSSGGAERVGVASCRKEMEELSACVESSLSAASSAGTFVRLNCKGLASKPNNNHVETVKTYCKHSLAMRDMVGQCHFEIRDRIH